MRAGSKASASRARLGRTPSIHMVSALTWKNGASPSSGSALTTPPPVPSTWSRSSEMITRGRLRVRDVIDDLVGQIMHVDDGLADAGVGELVEHVIEQRLARHAHQRLWHPVGQRPHAQAETGGEDHGFGGFDGHFRSFSKPICSQLRGSYHGDSRAHAIVDAIAAGHDGCTTASCGSVQTSRALAGARLPPSSSCRPV